MLWPAHLSSDMTSGGATAGLVVVGLLTDHSPDPLGIDEERPRFSWRLESDRRAVRQTAYRIVVSVAPGLDEEGPEVWDSGWVESSLQLGVEYDGVALASRTRYRWNVAVRTADRMEAVGPTAHFETAFLSPSEWTGEWIGAVTMAPGVASPLFRHEFNVDAAIVRARVYVCGLGYYELLINGHRIGDSVLDPAWTDSNHRVLYATYDVGQSLRLGPNVIGVSLGNGWFEPMPGAVPGQLQPQMLLELHLELADGRSVAIVTGRGSTWAATVDGPIRDHSIYGGETYDLRREIRGWAEPGPVRDTEEVKWRRAVPVEPPAGFLQAQSLEPIQVIDELAPISITRLGPDSQVVDFGQNFAGWVKIRLCGDAGSTVSVRHAELLDADGALNVVSLRSATATDTYVLDGGAARWLEPHFTYHGFRYAQVDGFAPDLTPEDIVGRVVRSSVPSIGRFACSDPLIEQIHRNIVWTEAGNLHGLPTDCPQRDERLAWLNDMTVRAEEAVHNFGLARLYSKWFDDIIDTQGPVTGAISDTAPFVRFGRRPADPVVSSFLVVPKLVSSHYGESRLIERGYDNLARWVSYLGSLRVDGIVGQSEIGDWAPPVSEAVEGSAGSGAVSAQTPGALISTGFLFMNLILMADFARQLGKAEDQRRYEAEAKAVKHAINDRFFDPTRSSYGPGNQSSNGFALYLDLVPEQHKAAVLASLVRDIEDHDFHLTTGNLCTKYVMDVLGRLGRADVAWRLLTQRTYPSWGYMVEMGATTIWERWEHVTGGDLAGMGSHNHPMYGAVGSWFYRYLGGILPVDESPGFGEIAIEPLFVNGLEWVDCELQTPRGLLSTKWRREGSHIELDVTIPPNSTASVLLPFASGNASDYEISEGDHPLDHLDPSQNMPAGLKSIVVEPVGARLMVGSGEYRFRLTRAARPSVAGAPEATSARRIQPS